MGRQLLRDLPGELGRQSSLLVVRRELRYLEGGIGGELQPFLRDERELPLPLRRLLGPRSASERERAGDRRGRGGGDEHRVRRSCAGEALEDPGRRDDSVVRVDGPGAKGPRAEQPQICHAPPRRRGTASPSRVTPSTSSSGEPIMKSTWTELVLIRAMSSGSSIPSSYALPSAM